MAAPAQKDQETRSGHGGTSGPFPLAPTGENSSMITDPQGLCDFRPAHEFFVGIDSDGCAFDTMEIKHKECFCPNIIKWWDLQAVSKYAREAAEFVNLYSKSRGINRFPALIETLEGAPGHEVRVDPGVGRRAKKPIERMLAFARQALPA